MRLSRKLNNHTARRKQIQLQLKPSTSLLTTAGVLLYWKNLKLETVCVAEPLQIRQHAPLMLSTLGSKEKREGG